MASERRTGGARRPTFWPRPSRPAPPSTPCRRTCAPANAAEAVQVQVAMLERLGLEASGYKAGFTNPPMLEKAGPDGPMAGVMFRDFTINSGGSLKRSDVGPGALIEAEVSFRMGADLPAREGGYSEDEVIAAVDSAILGIEFAVPRLSNPLGQPHGASGCRQWCSDGICCRVPIFPTGRIAISSNWASNCCSTAARSPKVCRCPHAAMNAGR